MGKKSRRTRWRTLTITDEHSDSEESNTTTSGQRIPKSYSQKSYYSRFTYSSQSTPTRRYQCDGTKSTRSSSTASENKITFNEDEYTRITTPRQDVLFKKGYLNKPKTTYQTQTSTGNSTTSTGNSTGNGTPDHQSTDLEYESQFVFPNGFVDQNGIYYVNSFEPYPVMVYNPPTYYPEYTNVKTKRCSTGSLTESTSPNNEETSQDLSQQSETPSNVSELNHHMYNVIYHPGYYYNGVCQPQDMVCEAEPRRVKKRRRRKLSRSKQEGTTSESSDEIFSDEEEEEETKTEECPTEPPPKVEEDQLEKKEEEEKEAVEEASASEEKDSKEEVQSEENEEAKKYDLKPDAEEFVPRAAYVSHPEATIPVEVPANVQFIKIPSNFVPLPAIINTMGEFNAFIPPGIPINFIPQQNYVNFVPYKHPVHQAEEAECHKQEEEEESEEEVKEEEKKEESREAATVEVPNKVTNKNQNPIDIAKIVSKLEEAAKEQEEDVKEETKINNVRKRHKFQKVELRKPPVEEKKWQHNRVLNSPKKEEIAKPARNYSDTLKRSIVAAPCERHENHMERTKIGKADTKNDMVKHHQRAERTPPKIHPTEWISVSRKKRKNKNVEESEEAEVEEKTESITQVPEEVKPEAEVPREPPPVPPVQIPEEKKEEPKVKTKKKSKKNHAKTPPPTVVKRVMITDVDLSSIQEEMKKQVEEVRNQIEETKTPVEEVKIDEPEPEVMAEEPKEEEEEVMVDLPETVDRVEEKLIEDDKKEPSEKKSKKKKKKIAAKTANLSQSSSNATLNVNDDSYDFLLDESLDKTNVEISQELDKMIQRGMYSSLEEKIKSMNMESPDNFFKSIISNISSRESSVEKSNAYIKTPNFTKLMTSPAPPHVKEPCDFLAEPTTPDAPTARVEGGDDTPTPSDDDRLYPITRAVKEWMTKTRETTPDVEILKSPSAIFKEFCSADGEKNEAREEEVIFNERKTSTSSSVEEGEDVVECYESKYGKNEDFLKIQAEVEELKNGYPKHANLPYRAICCSIM